MFDIIHDSCFIPELGDQYSVEMLRSLTVRGIDKLAQARSENTLPLLNLPESYSDIENLKALVERFKKFEKVVVVGTGGSSSGGQALLALRSTISPVVEFMDNLTIRSFEHFLKTCHFQKTGFIFISKSGTTGEVMAQARIITAHLKQHRALQNAVAITEPKKSPLRDLAMECGFDCLDHDPLIGGRFSVLSNVGVLPAMIAGLDVLALRKGAEVILQETLSEKQNSRVALGSAIMCQSMEKFPLHVLMPYVGELKPFTFWYRQLWAESLGKNGRGSTPIDAMGTVDQHSQLQLYLDGPRDKIFTLILEDTTHTGPLIPHQANPDMFDNRALGDVLAAHQRATLETLRLNKRPVRYIQIQSLNEKTLGGLLMYFMLETILTADLMGVDAFDQPAVEQGKILVKQYLSARSEELFTLSHAA